MKLSKEYITILALSCGLSMACGNNLNQQQIRKTAPKKQDETGLLVSGITPVELEELMASHQEGQVRLVNPHHGLYEIYGIGAKEIKGSVPGANVSNNQFFQFFNQSQPADLLELLENDSVVEVNFESCKRSTNAPKAEVKLLAPLEDIEDGTINLGKTFVLDSSQSTSPQDKAENLKHAWVVAAPVGSKQSRSIHYGNTLEFTPDSMGMYSILLVVQDSHNLCGINMGGIVVTDNKPFEKEYSPVDLAKISKLQSELGQFQHLSEMQTDQTWRLSSGQGSLIAVIDSGVNYNHFALKQNMEVNDREIPNNGLDDDGNGFVDDYIGYDFSNNDAHPFDDQGHGSHVSGLAASPIFGMAKNAKILAVKALSPAGGDIGSITGAIYYAVDRGANVINMSFGSYGNANPELQKAVDYAESKGVLLVAAAGNGHPIYGIPVDTDSMPNYPSAFKNENIVAVAAKSSRGLLAPYSNYGKTTVDVVSPGGASPDDDMLSCFLENAAGIEIYGMSGTSMASPIVAGVAAQVMALNPKLTNLEVKEILINSGKIMPELKEKVVSSRYLDAIDALNKAKSVESLILAKAI